MEKDESFKFELPGADEVVELLDALARGGVLRQNDSGKQSVEHDAVNHPKHYTAGKIEVIDFIDDQKFGFYEGQVVKYVCRAKYRGTELQDLKKGAWYLNRLITLKEKLD